ncbi:MAG: dihydrodipicolinate synthase family protein [Kiritimatiellae bacterium]|nr:dihydrodipicolinate synthase family protein [Kiritimatiellia bacterium]
MKLKGLIPPMVTPLNERRQLDSVGTKNMVKHLLDGGVDGIFLLGTSGEGPHLDYAVRVALVQTVCRLVKGRVPVLVGITETNLDAAVAFAKQCKAFGANGVVAAPPYYFQLSQEQCVAWYTELANRVPIPLVIYNMPAHTKTVLEPETIVQLAPHPNIVGMKDSSSIIALFNKFRVALAPFREKFSLFMGPDEAMGEAILLGADGGVCTGANLWPKAFAELYRAATEGNVEKVRELQAFTTSSSYDLYGLGQGQIGFLQAVKCALSEMGLIQNVLAAPFSPLEGQARKRVQRALRRLTPQSVTTIK